MRRPFTAHIGGGPAPSPRLAMGHHYHKRRRLIRELHGHGQELAPIGKARLALVREEEILFIGIQIGRQAHAPERFAHGDGQILGIRAVIIDY
jgi:hypothetical protein